MWLSQPGSCVGCLQRLHRLPIKPLWPLRGSRGSQLAVSLSRFVPGVGRSAGLLACQAQAMSGAYPRLGKIFSPTMEPGQLTFQACPTLGRMPSSDSGAWKVLFRLRRKYCASRHCVGRGVLCHLPSRPTENPACVSTPPAASPNRQAWEYQDGFTCRDPGGLLEQALVLRQEGSRKMPFEVSQGQQDQFMPSPPAKGLPRVGPPSPCAVAIRKSSVPSPKSQWTPAHVVGHARCAKHSTQ